MTLTDAEKTFILRMAPHIERGLTFEQAAKAVLDDDERLFAALCDWGHQQHVDLYDRPAHYTGERKGDIICREMAREVYTRIRGGR